MKVSRVIGRPNGSHWTMFFGRTDWFGAMFFGARSTNHVSIGETEAASAIPSNFLTESSKEQKTPRLKSVSVALSKDRLLKRDITLPPAKPAERHAMAELDMVRRTPFKPDETHWVLLSQPEGSENSWSQFIIKTSELDRYRSNLSSHGYDVRRFTLASDNQIHVLADYAAEQGSRARFWRVMNAGLLCLAVGILGATWLYPAYTARQELIALNSNLEAARREAVSLRNTLSQMQEGAEQRATFIASIVHRRRLSVTLRELTVALPDDVWVSDLGFQQDQIAISGETSGSASELVLTLGRSNLNWTAALTGAVSKTAQGHERFSLALRAQEDS